MASLKEYNEFGQLVCTVEDLLAPVILTGVATTSGQAYITCASTTGVYPGMVLRCAGFARPCIVHAVRDSTTLNLVASAFSSSGVWTTEAANAQASVSYTAPSTISATVVAFDPQAIVSVAYAMGMWRNTIRANSVLNASYGGPLSLPNNPWVNSPTFTGTALSAWTTYNSDELTTTPVKRHNGEFWSFYFAVSTGGQLSKIPAISSNRLVYAA